MQTIRVLLDKWSMHNMLVSMLNEKICSAFDCDQVYRFCFEHMFKNAQTMHRQSRCTA